MIARPFSTGQNYSNIFIHAYKVCVLSRDKAEQPWSITGLIQLVQHLYQHIPLNPRILNLSWLSTLWSIQARSTSSSIRWKFSTLITNNVSINKTELLSSVVYQNLVKFVKLLSRDLPLKPLSPNPAKSLVSHWSHIHGPWARRGRGQWRYVSSVCPRHKP